MQEEELLLISLLEERLIKLKQEINEAEKDSRLSSQNNLIKDLKKDKNHLREIDIKEIEKILEQTKIKNQNQILHSIDIIQTLLNLNKEKHTTFKLTESQLEPINILIKTIEEQEKEKQKAIEQKEQEQKDYQNLLNKILKQQEPITELNIMKHLFKDLSITEETQSRILLGLMKYNKNIYSPEEFLIPEWDS